MISIKYYGYVRICEFVWVWFCVTKWMLVCTPGTAYIHGFKVTMMGPWSLPLFCLYEYFFSIRCVCAEADPVQVLILYFRPFLCWHISSRLFWYYLPLFSSLSEDTLQISFISATYSFGWYFRCHLSSGNDHSLLSFSCFQILCQL